MPLRPARGAGRQVDAVRGLCHARAVQTGVLQSHLHTREQNCPSLFAVLPMGQLRVTGADRQRSLESVVVGDLQVLGSGKAKLILITNDQGGILDDCYDCNGLT
ncbi:hypothetical protein PR001_g12955 [Phytophthora rubi]|nr:hypothetical protein PR001_g12955 [Phytophthora rubi]